MVLGQVFSEYFSFHCQFLSHQMFHTTGLLAAEIPSGLILTPSHAVEEKTIMFLYCFIFSIFHAKLQSIINLFLAQQQFRKSNLNKYRT
jgi:hypothetical protein